MKIVIFIKGPIRPDLKFCLSNFQDIINSFVDHEVKVVLHTWNNPLDREFVEHLSTKIDLPILVDEPDRIDVETNLLRTRTPDGCCAYHAYKHFYTMKNGSNRIYENFKNFDFVFYCRIDTSYKFYDLNQCFEKDAYVSGPYYLDITGCATPKNFMKAWDYKDLLTLNSIYGSSTSPERCLEQMMRMNSGPFMPKNFRDAAVHPVKPNVIMDYVLHPGRRNI